MSIRQAPKPAPKPPIACANAECDQQVQRGTEYSFIITFATRGADPRTGSFQCPDANEIMQGNVDAQHFCCSAQCAAIVAHACIDEHLLPQHHTHVMSLAAQDAADQAEKEAMEAHRKELEDQANER